MKSVKNRSNLGDSTRMIAADIPISTDQYPIEQLLNAFRELTKTDDTTKLYLTGRRDHNEIYSVWNYIDQHQLTDRVEFFPYFERSDEFPVLKKDCDLWIPRSTPKSVVTSQMLRERLDQEKPSHTKHALFFTSFHPEKQEGNSTLMRLWLDHLKLSGYRVHVAYYMYDQNAINSDMRRAAYAKYDLYREIPVKSKLTGANYNGLNVHVDDWCGKEALDSIDELVSQHEYDIAITNYPFMSAVLDRVQSYTQKILLTHDSFVDRNRRMLEQGYPESGWISLDARGETKACERADIVVAMQEIEAEKFRKDTDPEKVQVIGPIFDTVDITPPQRTPKLKIGYFGSSNWVNEQNLGEYLKHWAKSPELMEHSEIHIAGGVCETLHEFVPSSLLRKINPIMIGRVDTPKEFFESCDLIINPERGGTGIKIKTLESLAHGTPTIGTSGAFVGLGSENPFHNATSFEQLADQTKSFILESDLIDTLRDDCVHIYQTYCQTQQARMNALLGAPLSKEELAIEQRVAQTQSPVGSNQTKRVVPKLNVPSYVQENCSEYHIEEFEQFRQRTDIRGKRVLEIGSDYHLVSARLFKANGARSVTATNIGTWSSDEPLPDGVEFLVGDAANAGFEENSFDIIYGIAILEHIPDYEKLAKALSKYLKPDGVIYFQGCPLWAGSIGHHVWHDTVDEQGNPVQYSFTNNNPIPNWAHLALTPDELIELLIEQGIPEDHAQGMINYIHNQDGVMIGSCSNYRSASEVINALSEHFQVASDPIKTKIKPNEFYQKALEQYSSEDLQTLGLRLWGTHKECALQNIQPTITNPTVSIIIPFYGVEAYIEDCIKSVLKQEYQDLEIIFVDDQCLDGSRAIVEKYAQKDARIKLVTHEVNKGLGLARNTGVENATGYYLFFLDSDDYFTNAQSISKLVQTAQTTGSSVVVGSCDRIMTDGTRLAFDRDFDKSHNGTPDQFISPNAAFLGASFIPGGKYVPMRAWGTLIERFMYDESGLEYPAGEHEDLPHTPFLYHFAKGVYYSSDIVVTYRDRSDSISNTGWNSARIQRQGYIWTKIKENILKFGLDDQLGNATVKTAEHLIMKLRQNGIEQGSEQAAIDVIEQILMDTQAPLDHGLLFYTLDSLRSILDFQKYDYNLYHKLTGNIPPQYMGAYYRHRINEKFSDQGPVPIHPARPPQTTSTQTQTQLSSNENPVPVTSAPSSEIELKHVDSDTNQSSTTFDLNHIKYNQIEQFYKSNAPKVLKKFPSMLTTGDKALYFDAGYNYQFKGAIVDAGCFIGGTTMGLVQGLLQNPLFKANEDKAKNLIRVYDLFEIDDDYILGHLQRNYPKHDFTKDHSFLEVFNHNLKDYQHILDVRPGDVIKSGYADTDQIEILGVDLCKALPVTDFVVREFFPRLIPGARVIQQDFIHQYHPHIHLSMMKLDDYFDLDLEVKWGGSVSYILNKPITPEIINERFGHDSSWYNAKSQNESLLWTLMDRMLYDENKWVILQVISVYTKILGDQSAAIRALELAENTYPQFDIPDEVHKLVGNGAMV